MAKVIAILGATGAQGGGLADAILNDQQGGFTVRAITRDTSSEKAKALAQRGAQVVAADIDDPASLRKAFDGAYGVYGVTFYWAHMNPDRELAEGKTIAQTAKDSGVEHVIWSTLDDSRKLIPLSDNRMPTLMGKYKVPHFDAKGESDRFFTEFNVPTTFLLTTFYWENFIYFGMGPKRGEDGVLALNMPMAHKKLAGIAAGDIGKCAYGVFKGGSTYINKTVGIAGDACTGDDMAAAMSKAFGETVRYNALPPEVFRSFGFPGADDLGNMFQFYAEFEDHFLRTRDLQLARKLNPQLQNFERWLQQNASRIPR